MKTFGRYTIKREVGRGGMGVVWEAYDPKLERAIAIKTLILRDMGEDQIAVIRERFLREGRTLARLNHPHVLTIYDVGEEDGELFLAMEFLKGHSLGASLDAGEYYFAPERFFSIIKPLAEAIDAVHLHGIIHRDLKPDNIFIREDGVVKLVDFGIARPPASRITKAGVTFGTPQYMAPEQIKGNQELDGRTDIFSMGVIAYEMLTGTMPFRGETVAIISQIMFRERKELVPDMEHLPPGVRIVLLQALAIDPDDRPDSGATLVRRLMEAFPDYQKPTPSRQMTIDPTLSSRIQATGSQPIIPRPGDPPKPAPALPVSRLSTPPAATPGPVAAGLSGRLLWAVALALVIAAGIAAFAFGLPPFR